MSKHVYGEMEVMSIDVFAISALRQLEYDDNIQNAYRKITAIISKIADLKVIKGWTQRQYTSALLVFYMNAVLMAKEAIPKAMISHIQDVSD